METIDISIIVPVYNTGKYIAKCLNSLINQTIKNIEIIIINDGSQDNSEEICKGFLLKDKRIKLINQKNSGQGAARNRGLEVARGKYIAFVDSDDYIELNMYEKLVYNMKKYNCDIVACQVNMVDEEKIISNKKNMPESGYIETGYEAMERYLKLGRWGVCDKLYKKEILKNVKFLEGRTCGEDHAVIVPILKNVKKMVTIDDYLYNYLVRKDSTTTSTFSIKNFDTVYVWEEVRKQVKGIDKNISDIVEARIFSNYIDLVNCCFYSNKNNFKTQIEEIAMKIKENRQAIYKNKYIIKRYKIGTFILNINFKLYKNIYLISRLLKER